MLIAVFYVALYRESYRLMSIALAMLAVFVVMDTLTLFYRLTTKLYLPINIGIFYKGQKNNATVKISTKGFILPQAVIYYTYGNDKKQKISIYCAKKECTANIPVIPDKNGIYTLKLVKLRLYDPFMLSYCEKKLTESLECIVFPTEQLSTVSKFKNDELSDGNAKKGKSGEEDGDIRQLREYNKGDLPRKIHWKKSAQLDELWVKEYDKSNSELKYLLVGIQNKDELTDEYIDKLYAYIHKYTFSGIAVKIFYNTDGTDKSRDLISRDDIYDLLLELYRAKTIAPSKSVRGEMIA